MLRTDAKSSSDVNNVADETYNIDLDVVTEIEKQLQDDPYDMISLVFLLYDVPDTALQRLVVYQRVMSDGSGGNVNLLQEWYRHASLKPNWKHELLEALLICQLNSIVKNLGFHVPSMKRYYQTSDPNVSMYINPAKKLLYHICENINSDNLGKLKKSLLSYDINVMEYKNCELIFLELLSQKFITINSFKNNNKSNLETVCNAENLARILENVRGLKKFAIHLRALQTKPKDEDKEVLASTSGYSTPSLLNTSAEDVKLKQDDQKFGIEDFTDLINGLESLSVHENGYKSDTTSIKKDRYIIKNPDKLGVCLVINQENFYPSRQSIDDHQIDSLEERKGSTIDKKTLERTMTSLKFEVHSCSDLDHIETIQFIKTKIRKYVSPDDSIFMLCILSHGTRDHVYAADSVKIKVESIQNMLDSDELSCLRGIPKVFIIQACQVDETSASPINADSLTTNYHLGKLDFLVYWATAPEYEAFRHEDKGSFFIQALCKVLRERNQHDHLHEIFTQVNCRVTDLCTKLKRAQVPIFKSTLRKNLYLQDYQ